MSVALSSSAPATISSYRFVALGVVWSAYLVVFLSRLCVGPLAPFLKETFHLTNAQVGWLTGATAVAYAPTLILAGWLVDRIGARVALVIGTLITGVAVGAVALVPSYGMMLLLLVLSGLGCGFIYPTAVKAIMLWFPPQERATAVGVNQSAVNVSGMLGAAIMPALAAAFGWWSGFLAAGALALLVCGVAVLLYRDPSPALDLPPARRPEADSGSVAAFASLEEQGIPSVTGDPGTDRASVKPGFLAVARSRDILLMGSAAGCLCMVEFAALAHMVLYLQADWAYTAVAAGALLAFCQGAGAIGKPLSGLVSDRLLGRRRRMPLMVVSLLAGAACVVFALAGPDQEWLLWPALAVLGIGAVGWGGLMGALVGETAGLAAAGAAAGVTAAIDNIGIFVGPPLFGFVVDRTGSYAPAWWMLAAASVAAAALFALVRERRRI